MTDWTISVVDSTRVKGKPPGWFPAATELLKVGVPLEVAQRWKRQRWNITVGLKRRLKESRN